MKPLNQFEQNPKIQWMSSSFFRAELQSGVMEKVLHPGIKRIIALVIFYNHAY